MTEQATVVTTGGDGQAVQGQAASTQPQGQTVQPGSQATGQQTPEGVQTIPQGADQPGATPSADEVRQVPLSALKTIETKLKEANAKNQSLESQINQARMIQQMGGNQPPQPPVIQPNVTQPPAQPANVFEGYQDTDLLSVADMKKIVDAIKPAPVDMGQALKPVSDQLARMQVQIQDPHYEQTIRTYLPEIITAQPFIRAMIERSPNPLLAALTAAKMSPKYAQDHQPQQTDSTVRQEENPLDMLQNIINTATTPASPASMGSAGAVQGFDRFRNMSEAEFAAEVERVKNGR